LGKFVGLAEPSEPAAGAILGRFLQHAQIIAMTGRSYRLKDKSKEKTCKTAPKKENTKVKKGK